MSTRRPATEPLLGENVTNNLKEQAIDADQHRDVRVLADDDVVVDRCQRLQAGGEQVLQVGKRKFLRILG